MATKQRRDVILALTAAYMLVQLSSLPVALTLPSLAEHFNTGIDEVAWIVIGYLLMLGGLVLLSARLGDRYGHSRVFFLGILVSTTGSALISLSQELWQAVLCRAISGVGAAMVMGNANAILAATFPPEERGRAFSIPVVGARFGTLTGLALFGLFLHFFSWRLVFLSFLPLGAITIAMSIPMLRHRQPRADGASGPIDWIGALTLACTAAALILSGAHLHGGEESYVSSDALSYHIPMHVLFLVLLVGFVLIERTAKTPIIDLSHFRTRSFSLALGSNVTYHFSMLTTMTLVPILVENGYGKSPLFVTVVLFPSQTLGMFMPLIAGWIYDKHWPPLLRPMTMMTIAGGFLLLGLTAPYISFWALPFLMLPIAMGTSMFNPINNAAIMNSLPLEHRGVASGMLETTREIGHAMGATAAAAALGLALPVAINLLPIEAAQIFFIKGFRNACLMVVFTLFVGAALACFHKERPHQRTPSTIPPEPSTISNN